MLHANKVILEAESISSSDPESRCIVLIDGNVVKIG
jgi:hypothetical protein